MSNPAEPPLDIDAVVGRFGDLPTLAPVAMEVLRLAEDERAGLDDIAAAISHDPALSGQLLRLANSSLYSTGREVTSLSRAATVLGLRTVKLLSLSFSLVANVGSDDEGMDVWKRSLAGSALARSIAAHSDPRLGDECFVTGLLAHLGKLALADEPAFVAMVETHGRWTEADVEVEYLGVTSDTVTRHILDRWELPPLFGQAVEHRRHPDVLDEPANRIARVLDVADAAAWLLTSGEDGEAAALEACRSRAARHLAMSQEDLEELLVDAAPAVAEMAEMFDVDVLGDVPVTDLLLRAKENLARVSLDVVAALSEQQQRANHLESENERLTTEATTDPLTGLPNRRAFDAYLDNQIAGRIRSDRPGRLGLMMIDIDHFKAVNDSFGHDVGDDVLRGLAEHLLKVTRRGEMLARLGGEEFAVVLPATDANEIVVAGERFRSGVAAQPFDTGIGPLEITVSIGVVCASTVGEDTAAHLYKAADEALYAAKHGGRDRVAVGDDV